MPTPFITFRSLSHIRNVKHGFTTRNDNIDLNCEREEAVSRLRPFYEQAIDALGFSPRNFVSLEQVHGDKVIVIDSPNTSTQPFAEADGLVTFKSNLLLGIFVADCCAVFITDIYGKGVSVVHSGKKGSELSIIKNAIIKFNDHGIPSSDLLVQLSPCIGPPNYEVDFVNAIFEDCVSCGVAKASIYIDSRCTSQHLDLFYSYRMEQGKTGRMLAMIGKR